MNECCKNLHNLNVVIKEGAKITRKCKVCGLRHIEMDAEAGRVGIEGKSF